MRALFRFCVSPIVDTPTGGPSITRLLCIAGFVLLWHSVEKSHPITQTHLWFFVVIMAAAFGKSTFNFLLTRAKGQAETVP